MSLAAQRCIRTPSCIQPSRRLFSTSPVARAGRGNKDKSKGRMSKPQLTHAGFRKFFGEDGEGPSLKKATHPQQWLPGLSKNSPRRPFPMNPSFLPPPPTSDALRSRIYALFMEDPKKNSVRELSLEFHLSMKRVDAILRLKGLEAHMLKNDQPLQTGFSKGMERILGSTGQADSYSRYNVQEADILDHEEGNDRSRDRYQHLFWESVAEGDEPLVPGILQKAQQTSESFRKEAFAAKSHPRLVPRHEDSPPARIQLVSKPGRPTMRFVDVGGKFLEVRAVEKRMAQSEKRREAATKKKEAARVRLLEAMRTSSQREPAQSGWNAELKNTGL